MSVPHCYDCGHLLDNINAACPVCLPNFPRNTMIGQHTQPPIDHTAVAAILGRAHAALTDIALGMGECSPPDAMLQLGKGGFHQAFVPLLQKRATEGAAAIDAFARERGIKLGEK